MRVALAQIAPIVGDYAGNVDKVVQAAQAARAAGAGLLVAPELCLCGYPPRDLLDRAAFIDDGLHALSVLAARIPDIEAVVGFVDRVEGRGLPLRNAAAVIRGGQIVEVHHKRLLPTYDVFSEDRWFAPAETIRPARLAGRAAALTVCEDVWSEAMEPRYDENPVDELVRAGARMVVNISASPWNIGKEALREDLLRAIAVEHGVPVLYCNQVGGNDELLFDGGSVYLDASGTVRARGAPFAEDLVICDLDEPARSTPLHAPLAAQEEAVRRALVMGVQDYASRCGFSEALLGLSGGIDSALVCAVAAEALGPDNVLAVSMPSRYSSEGSRTDAAALAGNLGVRLVEHPIEGPFDALLDTLAVHLQGRPPDVTEENLQARIRGTLLMALSNRYGSLLLTTGNKSELAVGYCTLYGDMNGGLAVISDLPKTLVYRVARHLNEAAGTEVIPASILDKPPSAELKPDQADQDSLPPYDLLDAILDRYVVARRSSEQMIEEGLPAEVVRKVIAMVDRNEYKRRQAAPGLRVTSRAFGMGRRVPIAKRRTRA